MQQQDQVTTSAEMLRNGRRQVVTEKECVVYGSVAQYQSEHVAAEVLKDLYVHLCQWVGCFSYRNRLPHNQSMDHMATINIDSRNAAICYKDSSSNSRRWGNHLANVQMSRGYLEAATLHLLLNPPPKFLVVRGLHLSIVRKYWKTKSNLYKHRKSHAHRIKAGLASSREDHSFSGAESGTVGDEQGEEEAESTDSEDETGQRRPSTSQERPALRKSSKVELSFSEEGPRPEDSQAIKQRLAMRLSERKRVPMAPDETPSSLLGPGSKGSTESGYFSSSGSAELSQTHIPTYATAMYTTISQILVTTRSQQPICCTAMVIMGQLEANKLQHSYLRLPTLDIKTSIPMSLPLVFQSETTSDDGCGPLGAGGNKRMLSPAGSLELSLEAQRQQKRVKEEEEEAEEEERGEDKSGEKCLEKSNRIDKEMLSARIAWGKQVKKTEEVQESVENKLELAQVHANPPSTAVKVKGEPLSKRSEKEKKNIEEGPTTSKQSEPPRICIFEGGYKSNEEYVYVRGRGRGKYVCGECGIRCKKPSMLKKHIRTHTDIRPYVCKHCNFAFKTKGNLTKHMKSKAHGKKCQEMGVAESNTDELEAEDPGTSEGQFCESEDAEEHQFSDVEDSEDEDDNDEDDDDDDDDDDNDEEEEVLSSHDEPPSSCSTDTHQSDSGQGSQTDLSNPTVPETEDHQSPCRPWSSGRAASPGSKRVLFSHKGWEVSPRAFSPASEGSPLRSLSPRLELSSPSRHLSPSPERGPSPVRASLLRPLSPLQPLSPARHRSSRAHVCTMPLRPQHRPHSSPGQIHWESSSQVQEGQQVGDFNTSAIYERPGTPSTPVQERPATPGVPQAPQRLSPPHHSLLLPTLRFCQSDSSTHLSVAARTMDRMFSHLPLHSQDQARMPYHMIPIGGIQMVQLRPRPCPKLERSSSLTPSPTSPKEDFPFCLSKRDTLWSSRSETSQQKSLAVSGTQSLEREARLSGLQCQATCSTTAKWSLQHGSMEPREKDRKQYGSSQPSKTYSVAPETSQSEVSQDNSEGAEKISSFDEEEARSSLYRTTEQLSELERPKETPSQRCSSTSEGTLGEKSTQLGLGFPVIGQSEVNEPEPAHRVRTKRCSCNNQMDSECHYFCHLDIIWVNTPRSIMAVHYNDLFFGLTLHSKITVYGLGSPLARRRRSAGRCLCANSADQTCSSFCVHSLEEVRRVMLKNLSELLKDQSESPTADLHSALKKQHNVAPVVVVDGTVDRACIDVLTFVRYIHLNDKRKHGIRELQNRGLDHTAFQFIKRLLGLGGSAEPTQRLPGQRNQWGCNCAQVLHEPAVDVHEAQEALDQMHRGGSRPVLYSPHLGKTGVAHVSRAEPAQSEERPCGELGALWGTGMAAAQKPVSIEGGTPNNLLPHHHSSQGQGATALNARMGKKGDLSDLERGMFVGAKLVFQVVCVFQKLLIYWDFHAQPSTGFTDDGSYYENTNIVQFYCTYYIYSVMFNNVKLCKYERVGSAFLSSTPLHISSPPYLAAKCEIGAHRCPEACIDNDFLIVVAGYLSPYQNL
ncbi:hypothetical protein P4O66_010234 [Electrophorus voltai]|uniref:C2H2-type domain-containing protein n=1 Tax=Electrophorus voltai TaxID=2609070 RepID=A0AAD9DV34_9TELE|nr:hypothetical protein P4O66_010234 [Electrophorus voltai]